MAAPKQQQHTSMLRDAAELALCAGGIYGCYLFYGVLHEKIFSVPRGDEQEKFSYSWFLVLIQCMVNATAAFIALKATGTKAPAVPVPKTDYAKIALTYIGAMVATNTALQFVDYPTQVLGKSVKMIPVMLMRIVIVNKRYKLRDYACVLLTTMGIAVFMLAKSAGKASKADTSPLGLGLLLLSLFLDAFTGPTQERVREQYKPSTHHMMLNMNLFALIYIACALVLTGELFSGAAFVTRHPEIVYEMLGFSCLSAAGQSIIMVTVFRFNSLVLTTITTTRKFFTILASVVWFGHTLGSAQWGGVALVFSGLILNTYHKYLDKKERMDAAKKIE